VVPLSAGYLRVLSLLVTLGTLGLVLGGVLLSSLFGGVWLWLGRHGIDGFEGRGFGIVSLSRRFFLSSHLPAWYLSLSWQASRGLP
jgi:hypothetical protein